METIYGSGLGAFYAQRQAYSANPQGREQEGTSPIPVELEHFDHPAVLQSFATRADDGLYEATFAIEGVTCAACVWLFEERLRSLPGVGTVDVNYATRKARLRWDQQRTPLSKLMHAVREVGLGALPSDDQAAFRMRAQERRVALWRLFVAAFGMMQIMMYAYPAYIAGDGDMSADQSQLLRIASLLLTLPVIAFSAMPFFRGAWRDVRARAISMDTPVALGIGAAFGGSVWATFARTGDVYFDSISMFVFLVLCARYLESISRERASECMLQLSRALPALAMRLMRYPDRTATQLVPAVGLETGDYVMVAAGESFPADARLVDQGTQVDESLLTGESNPVAKRPGDEVIGGSINVSHPVVVHILRAAKAGRLASIVRLVERAQLERPEVARMADRVARIFVVVVLVLAVSAAIAWMMSDPQKALAVSIAVLVVSCPCALSLATPAALAAATATLARRGFVVTRASTLERLANATHVVLDKTGTLTEGCMGVVDVAVRGSHSRLQCEQIAAALERDVRHPIATALRESRGALSAESVKVTQGSGIEGMVDGCRYRLGNRRWIESWSVGKVGATDSFGYSEIVLATREQVLAVFWLGDRVRTDARAVIDALRAQGKTVLLASGDQIDVVRRVARATGIDAAHGELSPEDKLALVRQLQSRGARVAMIGDGINDAPVLAQAHVAVAMGSGALLAQAAADAVLTAPRLSALIEGFRTASKTRTIIRQNLWWAFAYNLTFIPFAALGLITPWLSGVGMALSSALVVLNAMRLHRPQKFGAFVVSDVTAVPAVPFALSQVSGR